MLYHTYGGDTIKVGFIGPGKVGVSLGRYFTHKGIQLSGYFGRNINSTKEGAEITKSKCYENVQDIISQSDIIFITTPDDIISTIDIELSKFNLKNKSICHASGSLKSTVLYNSGNSGALIYSIHPIFAFSSKNTSLTEIEKIYFSIEGDNLEDSSLLKLVKILGNKYFTRKKEDSESYHLANVFVSNLMLSLLNIGTDYFIKLGLSEKEALNAFKPLILGNIESIFEKGFLNALTGPVFRGDVTTIQKHLSVLKEGDRDIYKALSLNLLKLTALKEDKNINSSDFVNEELLKNFLGNSNKHLEINRLIGDLE